MKKKDIFDSDDEEEEENENSQEGDKGEEKESKEGNSQENENENINDQPEITKKNIIELEEDKEKEKEKEDKTLYGIFIKGLPYEATEDELRNIFSKYGEIIKLKLPKYQNTNKNVGHCYLYYNNEKSALKSLEMNKHLLGKRYMEISLTNPITNHFKDKNTNIDPYDVPLDCKTAFVKNLSYNMTENEVDEKFRNCGQINAIRFVYDNQTKKFKGFCYIDFKEHKGLLKALKLNGSYFGERKIRVDFEQGKPKKGKYQ